ncbi:hypothetical protein J7G27_002584 [Vibrio vulnificus]|uniref:ORC-CDC6 family AAA ATPase n=1 Tax=Vibrio vulnificus TaxID=672 RepID=UPI0024DF9AD4|nr:hypothetical protein [Vibrio vulnificus]EHH1226312.1 hypothetical protein [Vibrio vulnificus]ELX4133046.1 hypothetical protein [Vibrio vulnificus]ELX4178095.1 hypothetical protein [Vibrio vulnificus]MDK2638744.1 hypothetical protein [Vibrio vulnificus]MDK2647101.1 hypothetical protein [Vibrio vulnificus]
MSSTINPFSVKTPETLSPEDIASLFVDVFSDYPKLLHTEHTFLHGARGTGKSMMLRFMEPKVQIAAGKVNTVSNLPFYAVHMPIKSSNYSLPELERLDGAPYWLLAEHFLIINATLNIISSLIDLYENFEKDDINPEFQSRVSEVLLMSGCDLALSSDTTLMSLKTLRQGINQERISARKYIASLAFTKELIPYDGTLFSYDDFFLPFVQEVKTLPLTSQGPIFLMLDDADNLPVRMQNILNGWVSYRTTSDICLKISTQQKYKTWRTAQGILIESAHDFGEIDISTVYTSKNQSHYYEKVEKIVERRLQIAGINEVSPEDFFPENKKQVEELKKIKEKIADRWDKGEKRISSRKSDDIRRYGVSEYMKHLNSKKKTNTFSYAGFKNMVDISSGMIRYFLEPASRMYAEAMTTNSNQAVSQISTELQDRVLYKWSEEYVLEEFERLKNDELSNDDSNADRVAKLKKLINSLGECFQVKLLSDDSERQLISFMVSSTPDTSVQDTLDLAVEWGYLTTKTIARKEGFGRNTLYTLNRRLAPYFKLDPSGYAAHMSITPQHLELAISDSNLFVRERLKKQEASTQQAQLF